MLPFQLLLATRNRLASPPVHRRPSVRGAGPRGESGYQPNGMGRVETGSEAPAGWGRCGAMSITDHRTPSSMRAHRHTLPSSCLTLRLGLRPTNASAGRDDPVICLHIHSSRLLGYTTAAVPRSHPHDCVSLGKLWACRHSPTCSPVATRSHLTALRLRGGSHRFTGKHFGASAESSH